MNVKHKKTGKIYEVIENNAVCTTNEYDQTELVIYRELNCLNIFVRDKKEFWEKFEEIQPKLKDIGLTAVVLKLIQSGELNICNHIKIEGCSDCPVKIKSCPACISQQIIYANRITSNVKNRNNQ